MVCKIKTPHTRWALADMFMYYYEYEVCLDSVVINCQWAWIQGWNRSPTNVTQRENKWNGPGTELDAGLKSIESGTNTCWFYRINPVTSVFHFSLKLLVCFWPVQQGSSSAVDFLSWFQILPLWLFSPLSPSPPHTHISTCIVPSHLQPTSSASRTQTGEPGPGHNAPVVVGSGAWE